MAEQKCKCCGVTLSMGICDFQTPNSEFCVNCQREIERELNKNKIA